MANKVFLFVATLAFCVLLTNASIYRTIVELDEDDATNPMGPLGPRQRCQREFQQAQHLRACQGWIRQHMRQGGGSPRLDIENPQGPQQQRPPLLQQCCNELRQEDPMCVCPTLKQAARAAVGFQGQEGLSLRRELYQATKNLPNICNIPQVGVCPWKSVFPSYY